MGSLVLKMNFVQWAIVIVSNISNVKNCIHKKKCIKIWLSKYFKYDLPSCNIYIYIEYNDNNNKKANVSWRADFGFTLCKYSYTVKNVIKGSEIV